MNRIRSIFCVLALVLAACGASPAHAETFNPALLSIVRVENQVAPLKTCTGVMIAPDWVLTSRACQSASMLRVTMPDSRYGVSWQAGVSAETFSFQDPAVDALLLSRVRRENRPFAVVNRHRGLQLDVAWASLKQNEAVNQVANTVG